MPPKKDKGKKEDDGEASPACRLHPQRELARPKAPSVAVNRTEIMLKNYKKACT